jgi:hypothetical protein
MSVVLLDTSVASLLHPKKKNDVLRAKYEPHLAGRKRDSAGGREVL